MADAVTTLGAASRDYEKAVSEYEQIALDAATAESDYKHAAAVFKTKARFEDPKVSAAYLDVMADADEELSGLLAERLRTAAVLDAAQKRISQLKERVSTGRTYVASERAADQIHAQGPHTT